MFARILGIQARLLPPCPLHSFVGIPCPTCGTTRAVLALAHGEIFEAVRMNPLVVLGGVLMLACVIGGLLIQRRTGRFPEPEWTPPRRRMLRIAVVSAILLNWGYLVVARV